jgi:hypothetical protein
MTEGIADYLRWFHYEPVAHKPVMSARSAATANYTGSYKITAGFLDYVAKNHDHEFVTKINADLRAHRYSPDLWVEYTGMSAGDLWKEYVASLPAAAPRRGRGAGTVTGTNTPALPQNLRIIPGDAPVGTNKPAPATPPAGG